MKNAMIDQAILCTAQKCSECKENRKVLSIDCEWMKRNKEALLAYKHKWR